MKTLLTDKGRAVLARALDGAQIQFTHAEFGSGQWTTQDDDQLRRDISAATSLRNPLAGADFDDTDQITPIGNGVGTVTVNNNFVLLSTQFNNIGNTNGWHITEIGYFVRDLQRSTEFEKTADQTITSGKVYSTFSAVQPANLNASNLSSYYEKEGDTRYNLTADTELDSSKTYYTKTDVVSPDTDELATYYEPAPFLYAVCVNDWSEASYVAPASVQAASFKHQCYVYVGDVADVTAILSNYIDAAPLDLVEEHIQRRDNPHGVTKNQIELGSVPNVPTNDQRPTFTEAETLENIDGGVLTDENGNTITDDTGKPTGKETLSTLLGKVKKAISALTAHIANRNNPHGVTAALISAASVVHKHSAEDITNDVLPNIHGGTGTSSGYGFTGSGYKCNGYAYLMGEKVGKKDDQNRLLIQWGRVNVDSTSADVTFEKEFANTDYVLLFPTCGKEFVPVWQNPTKRTTGFTMNKTFGIAQGSWNPFSNLLEINTIFGTVTIGKKLSDFFGSLFRGSQTADWLALGQAKN